MWLIMSRVKNRKMGRPLLKPQQRKSVIVTVRMTKKEHNELVQKAKKAEMPLSPFILRCLREEVE